MHFASGAKRNEKHRRTMRRTSYGSNTKKLDKMYTLIQLYIYMHIDSGTEVHPHRILAASSSAAAQKFSTRQMLLAQLLAPKLTACPTLHSALCTLHHTLLHCTTLFSTALLCSALHTTLSSIVQRMFGSAVDVLGASGLLVYIRLAASRPYADQS